MIREESAINKHLDTVAAAKRAVRIVAPIAVRSNATAAHEGRTAFYDRLREGRPP